MDPSKTRLDDDGPRRAIGIHRNLEKISGQNDQIHMFRCGEHEVELLGIVVKIGCYQALYVESMDLAAKVDAN